MMLRGPGLGRYDTLLYTKEGCRSAAHGTTIVHRHHLLRFGMAIEGVLAIQPNQHSQIIA